MRGYALLLGTCLTLAYAYAAQAAIAADRAGVVRRLSVEATAHEASPLSLPVWNGGTLTPITVEAADPLPPRRAASLLMQPADECPLPRHSRPAATGSAVRVS